MSSSRSSDSGRWSRSSRRPPRRSTKDYAAVDRPRGARRARRRAARRRPVRAAGRGRRPVVRARDARSASCSRLRRATRATCRSATRASPAAARSIEQTALERASRRCSRTRRSARSATTSRPMSSCSRGTASRSTGLDLDTMLASYLIDATKSSQELEPTVLEQLGYKALTQDEVCGKGVKALPFAQVPVDGHPRLRRASARTWRCSSPGTLAPMLIEQGLDAVYRDLELPLVPILADLERAGIRVDGRALAVAGDARREGAAAIAARRSSRWPARSSTSTRRSSSPRSCSTS